ncbi:UbiA prenyltransferase family-domain-containing protein [Pavlovales sp. CCMP2436]|nr:UbiA prenyltransferase family-domain-containing protein [Pavlovales sp. CCMP2436]
MLAGSRRLSSGQDTAAAAEAPPRPVRAMVSGVLGEWPSIYLELAKYRLSSLVVFTTSAGYAMAGPPFELGVLAPTLVGTFLASASASCLNQAYEIERDALMTRTKKRPLPSGKVSLPHALAFAAGTGVAGVGILAAFATPLTAFLGLSNIVIYSAIYTPLKVVTPRNTEVGAIVGALPPLMGWTAATGSVCGLEPLALGACLFLWQMPHFYALAWLHRADYSAGGYKMLPLYDPTGKRTASYCLAYALALSLVPVATSAVGVTSAMFAVESVFFNGGLIALALRFRQRASQGRARALFLYSLVQLPVMLTLLVFHGERLHGNGHAAAGEMELTDGLLQPPQPRDSVGDLVARLRDAGRELCAHEWVQSPVLEVACPVVLHEAASGDRGLKSLKHLASNIVCPQTSARREEDNEYER